MIYSAKQKENETVDVRFQIYNNAFQNLLGFQREQSVSELYEIPYLIQQKMQFKIKIKQEKVYTAISLLGLISYLVDKDSDDSFRIKLVLDDREL